MEIIKTNKAGRADIALSIDADSKLLWEVKPSSYSYGEKRSKAKLQLATYVISNMSKYDYGSYEISKGNFDRIFKFKNHFSYYHIEYWVDLQVQLIFL